MEGNLQNMAGTNVGERLSFVERVCYIDILEYLAGQNCPAETMIGEFTCYEPVSQRASFFV